MALAFEKRKKLYCRETGSKAQICLPHPGFGTRFKGNRLVCGSAGRAGFHRRALELGRLW